MEIETIKGLKKGETYWVTVDGEMCDVDRVNTFLEIKHPEQKWLVTNKGINIKEPETVDFGDEE